MPTRTTIAHACSAFLLVVLLSATAGQAAVSIQTEGDQSFSLGVRVRSSIQSIENNAPDGSTSQDVNLDNAWLTSSGTILTDEGIFESVGFQFNLDVSPGLHGNDNTQLLDGNLQFDLGPGHNFIVGRFLQPITRSNLSGPFFIGTYLFPGALEVGTYPVAHAGRDDGVGYWGVTMNRRLKYQFTAMEGFTPASPMTGDDMIYTARLQYNFWDREPAFVNASTYYGSKEILAISTAFQSESDAVVRGMSVGDYQSFNVEFLYEQPLASGNVPSLEISYQNYDKDNLGTVTGEGQGFFVLGGFLTGNWRPHVRFQQFEPEMSGQADVERIDAGIDYLLRGHNGRITAAFTDNFGNAQSTGNENSAVTLGLQFQI